MASAPCPDFSGDDLDDLEGGEGLPVPVLAAAELEDDYLLAQALVDDLRLDLGPAHEGLAQLERLATDHQDLVEGDRVAHAAGELLDAELVALLDPVLLAARLEYRVHRELPLRDAALARP